jgi:hypothetical protein
MQHQNATGFTPSAEASLAASAAKTIICKETNTIPQ